MPCPTDALSEADIQRRLESLPSWTFRENAIERLYVGKSYLDALEKLNAIAQLSEAADHHPDLHLSWKRLNVRYWTHVAHGVTPLDFALATHVESILQSEPLPVEIAASLRSSQ